MNNISLLGIPTRRNYALEMYKRVVARQHQTFNEPIDFTFSQFWAFLKTTEYCTIYDEYRRQCVLRGDRTSAKGYAPSIDRIDSSYPYKLFNIQLLTHQENSRKGCGTTIGMRTRSMRFFKKLREDRGLGKSEMAELLGILPSSYGYYEDKARGCSFEILCLLRRKLNLSWSQLGKLIEAEFGTLEMFEEISPAVRRKRGRPRKDKAG